jgi:hypothetical protein
MRVRALLAVVALAACKSGRPPEAVVSTPTPAPAIMYRAPSAPVTRSYAFADTTSSNIQAGPAGTINVEITSRGVADLRFETAAPNQTVTVTFSDFAGSFTNSAGGASLTAGLGDIKGATVFTLDARGVATVTARPEITPNFRTVVGSENNFKRFFTRVPGGVTQIGAVWTDTVAGEESNEGINSRVRNIVRSTYARDTVIAGKTLFVITGDGERWLEIAGLSQGVEIVQKLIGKVTSLVLWDPERSALVLKDERAALSGTFDLPAMSLHALPIKSSSHTVIQLRN